MGQHVVTRLISRLVTLGNKPECDQLAAVSSAGFDAW